MLYTHWKSPRILVLMMVWWFFFVMGTVIPGKIFVILKCSSSHSYIYLSCCRLTNAAIMPWWHCCPGWNYVMSVAGWASFPQVCRYVSPAMTEDTRGTFSPSFGINSAALLMDCMWLGVSYVFSSVNCKKFTMVLVYIQWYGIIVENCDSATCNR